jgi:hypothetical protein
MSENINYKVNRDGWPKGEWDNEPDRVDFIHAGFSCFILRNPLGAWCGYVGVPNTHPAYEKSYDDIDVNVHGGLTYAEKCSGAICHIPQAGMPDDVWWLGFDTAHSGDNPPSMRIFKFNPNGTYKDMNYVINETKQLADQLKYQEYLASKTDPRD